MIDDVIQYPFMGTYELRKRLTSLFKKLGSEINEVVITLKGKPRAVLVDIEEYLERKEALREFSDPLYLKKLLKSKKEFEQGKGIPAEKVYQKTNL